MNAKELRQAAEYTVTMWDNHDSKRLVAGDELFFNSDGEPDSVTFARHILSTVRDDDDELVTPERLVELGGVETPVPSGTVRWIQFASCDFTFRDGDIDTVDIGGEEDMYYIPDRHFPRNMKEARELLERCGAIKEEK